MSSITEIERVAGVFKALGNTSRLEIVCLLSKGSLTVGEIAESTGISQSLVSRNLKILKDHDLVIGERHGKEVIYALADEHVFHVVGDAFTHSGEGNNDNGRES